MDVNSNIKRIFYSNRDEKGSSYSMNIWFRNNQKDFINTNNNSNNINKGEYPMPHIQTAYGMQYLDQSVMDTINRMVEQAKKETEERITSSNTDYLSDRIAKLQEQVEKMTLNNQNSQIHPLSKEQRTLDNHTIQMLIEENTSLRNKVTRLTDLLPNGNLGDEVNYKRNKITHKTFVIIDRYWNESLAIKYNSDHDHPNVYLPSVSIDRALATMGIDDDNIHHFDSVDDVIEEYNLKCKINESRTIDLEDEDLSDTRQLKAFTEGIKIFNEMRVNLPK